jgi:hypothetical protein
MLRLELSYLVLHSISVWDVLLSDRGLIHVLLVLIILVQGIGLVHLLLLAGRYLLLQLLGRLLVQLLQLSAYVRSG